MRICSPSCGQGRDARSCVSTHRLKRTLTLERNRAGRGLAPKVLQYALQPPEPIKRPHIGAALILSLKRRLTPLRRGKFLQETFFGRINAPCKFEPVQRDYTSQSLPFLKKRNWYATQGLSGKHGFIGHFQKRVQQMPTGAWQFVPRLWLGATQRKWLATDLGVSHLSRPEKAMK